MFKQKIKLLLFLCLMGFVGSFFYLKSSSSNYQVACSRLGFATAEKQKALFDVFKIAGYLEPQSLWSAVYRSHIFNDSESVFIELADSSRFVSTKKYSDVEFAKLILYISQTAFDRKVGQERSELSEKSWMVERQSEYLEAATALGLMQSVQPDYQVKYDATLVLGASRPGLYPRLMELNHYFKMGLQTDQIFILAGQRELWAEIDGFYQHALKVLEEGKELGVSVDTVDFGEFIGTLKDKVEEGKSYMKNLADTFGIAYDQNDPFEVRSGRTYLRTLSDGEKITETTMSQDLISQFSLIASEVVDTAASENGDRPDTVSTAKDIAYTFVKSIVDQKSSKKVFNLLAVSNNPYIERQAIAIQREFNKALNHFGLDGIVIEVHGVGFKAKKDVANIHSEIGALCSELFKDAYPDEDTQHLMFRSRDNNLVVPDCKGLKN